MIAPTSEFSALFTGWQCIRINQVRGAELLDTAQPLNDFEIGYLDFGRAEFNIAVKGARSNMFVVAVSQEEPDNPYRTRTRCEASDGIFE